MAQPAFSPNAGSLRQRVVSALVLGPVALLAIYLGHPYIEVLIGIFGVAMAWEWARLCSAGTFGAPGWTMAASIVVVVLSAALRRHDLALVLVFAGAAAVYAAARLTRHRAPQTLAAGVPAIGLACLAFLWLRVAPNAGLASVAWLVGAVWATDIAAYFVGKRIGGPRLAPKISPKKTWSGLAGGVSCAALWGLLWGFLPGTSGPWLLTVMGGAIAIIAQIGDLSISLLKRRFGVKDTSDLIPGHGGVLDRVDGFITAAPIAAGFVLVFRGIVWPPL